VRQQQAEGGHLYGYAGYMEAREQLLSSNLAREAGAWVASAGSTLGPTAWGRGAMRAAWQAHAVLLCLGLDQELKSPWWAPGLALYHTHTLSLLELSACLGDCFPFLAQSCIQANDTLDLMVFASISGPSGFSSAALIWQAQLCNPWLPSSASL